MVIHPDQIDQVNASFSPTAEEIDYAERVTAAFEAAIARGSAATSVDGKMIDYAMATSARNLLRRAGQRTREEVGP
jgi:citrate lyase subunit beta/citryl-CoA lyase